MIRFSLRDKRLFEITEVEITRVDCIVKKSMKGPVKIIFWSIKNSCKVLNKLKSHGFRASSLSTYDFSTLYSTLPDNLLKDKLVDLIERTFQREGCPYIACNDRNDFFTSDAVRNYMYN